MTPKLSIIIPVYNAECYLERCVDSLLQQPILPHTEIILVENGSKDRSYEVAQNISSRHPEQVRLIKIDCADVSKARNAGIEAARGEYVAFVDSDDRVEEDMFSTLLSIAERDDADVAECSHYLCQIGTEKRIAGGIDNTDSGKITIRSGIDISADILTDKLCSAPWGRIYRRKLLGDNNLRFPEGVFYEDHACIYRWIEKADKVAHIDRPMYYYELHDGGITSQTIFNKKKCRDFFNAEYDRIQFTLSNPQYSESAKREIVRHSVHRCIHILGNLCVIAWGEEGMENPELIALRDKAVGLCKLPFGMMRWEDRIRLWRMRLRWHNYAKHKIDRRRKAGLPLTADRDAE